MTSKRPSGVHYAWIVLAAACVLSIAARADSAAFAVFVDPLVALFGWKRGDISFAYALAFLLGLPATIAMGWLGDRYGARPLMIGASLLISVGTVILGTSTELWQFYRFYALFVGSWGLAAVTGVAAGGSVVDAKVVESLIAARTGVEDSPLNDLTRRELEVLGQMSQGKSNQAIAADLFLSKRAVDKHINTIFMKLGLAPAEDISRRVMAALIYLAGATSDGNGAS